MDLMSEACRALGTPLSAGDVSPMLTLAAERADDVLNRGRIALIWGEDDVRLIPAKVDVGRRYAWQLRQICLERLSTAHTVQAEYSKGLGI
jgi:hypothetical protein